MFKLALAAAAFVAAGTTAIIVTQTGGTESTAAPATVSQPSRATVVPKLAPRRAQIDNPRVAAEKPNLPPGHVGTIPDDTDRVLDRPMIEKLKLDKGPGRGAANAPVTITIFTDLQCKYCMKAQASLDQLFEEYPGKLRLVVKQMPVHKTAELGAEAAYAAEAQGKFRELNELMIANHEDLSRDAILGLAAQAGLDVPRLRDALDKHSYADAVAEDIATAQALEFNGTPAFVINGRRIVGYRPAEAFREMIDAALVEK